jgi:hypothetical protein
MATTKNSSTMSPELLRSVIADRNASVLTRIEATERLAAYELKVNPTRENFHWQGIANSLITVVRDANARSIARLGGANITPQMIDRVVETLMDEQCSWLALNFALSVCGLPDYRRSDEFWKRSTYSAVDVISMLDDTHQKIVLAELLAYAVEGSYLEDPTLNIDAELTTMIMNSVSPKLLLGTTPGASPRSIFTKEATELLLSDPAWHHILWHQTLSLDQLKRFSDLIDPYDTCHLLNFTSSDREAAEFVMKLIDEDVVLNTSQVGSLLACLNDTNDPLFQRLVAQANENDLLAYVLGTWRFAENGVAFIYPDVKDVPDLSARLETFARNQTEFFRHAVREYAEFNTYFAITPMAYRRAIVDWVPGMYALVGKHQTFVDYTEKRLATTGASPEMIADQLAGDPLVSLSRLVGILNAFNRATSR